MLLLVDCWCNKIVIMSDSNYETRVIDRVTLTNMLKQNLMHIDNVTLNKNKTDLVCLSGSLDRLESMPKVVTVLSKKDNDYICYISSKVLNSSKDTGYASKIETYSIQNIRAFIRHEMAFNAFVRNSSIVIKGPLFSNSDSEDDKNSKAITKSQGRLVFSDIKRVDGELTPTIFELLCSDAVTQYRLVNKLKSEFNQEFMLDGEDSSFGVDNLKHDLSCYIKFAEKYKLNIAFRIEIYDIEELKDYAEDMTWAAEQFKKFMEKYKKYQFELDKYVKEILK